MVLVYMVFDPVDLQMDQIHPSTRTKLPSLGDREDGVPTSNVFVESTNATEQLCKPT